MKRGTIRTPALLALAAILLAAALLGFTRLGAKSLWLDEAFSWEFARDGARLVAILPHQEANMWLYYGAIHVWMRLFGESEFAIRSFSVLAALGTIPVLFWIGRRLFGELGGVAAALLLAVNPFFLSAAQEARGYALAVFLVVLSTALLMKALERKRLSGWFGYTLVAALAVYTHFFAALVLLGHGLILLMSPKKERPFRALAGSACLGFVLLLPIPLLQPLGGGQVNWIAKPAIRDLPVLVVQFAGGRIGAAAAVMAVALAACAALRARGKSTTACGAARAWVWVGAWLLVPILTAFLVSLLGKPVWMPRYLIVALPAFALLLAGAVARLGGRPVTALVVLAGLVAAQAAGLPAVYREEKQDWKSAVRWIAEHGRPGDGVYFAPGWLWIPYVYTANRHIPGAPAPVKAWKGKEAGHPSLRYGALNAPRARRLGRQHERIWVVAVRRGGPGAWRDLSAAVQALEPLYPVRRKRDFTGVRVVLMEKGSAEKARTTDGGPAEEPH